MPTLPSDPIDINQRLVQNLAHPGYGPDTVEALLNLGYGPFDRMSWHEMRDPQDPEQLHMASLWSWACQAAGITPAMQRLTLSVPERLNLLGDDAQTKAWHLFQNDAWGVLDQAQNNVPVLNRAWTLEQALRHLLATTGPFPTNKVRQEYPCALPEAFSVEADGETLPDVPEPWRTPMGRSVLHTLMAWALAFNDEVALRLMDTLVQVGVPMSVWWQPWALTTILTTRSFLHRVSSPWIAPFPFHLAQHDRWSLLLVLLPHAPHPWQRKTLHGAPGSPYEGQQLIDDLASKALRRTLTPRPGMMLDHTVVRDRTALLEQLLDGALASQPAARALLGTVVLAPWKAALQHADPERWPSDDERQRLLGKLNAYERDLLNADLPDHDHLAARLPRRL